MSCHVEVRVHPDMCLYSSLHSAFSILPPTLPPRQGRPMDMPTHVRLFDRSKLSCSSLATCLGKQDGLNLTWMSLLSFGTSKSDKKFNRTLNPTYVSCLCLKLRQISSAVVIG